MKQAALGLLLGVVCLPLAAQKPYDAVVSGIGSPGCFVGISLEDRVLQWVIDGKPGPEMAAYTVAAAPGGRVLAAVPRGSTFALQFATPGTETVPYAIGPAGYEALSMSVSRTGAVFVLARSETQRAIVAFSPAGTVTSVHPLPSSLSASVVDLAADQCTLFVAAGNRVARYDVCRAEALADFGPVPSAWDVRVLPDGGAVVLASGEQLLRYSAAGVLTHSYRVDAPRGEFRGPVISIALADGGGSVISATYCSRETFSTDLASGVVTLVGIEMFYIGRPSTIVPYFAWTAAVGASHVPTIPTASELALALLAVTLALAAFLRLR